MVNVRLLGQVRIELEGQRLDVQRALEIALMARLALEPGRVVADERLIDDLWGERLTRNPMANLQGLVYRLRGHLAGAGTVLRREGSGYFLDIPPDSVDCSRFEALVARSRRHIGPDQPQARRAVLREALALWEGLALTGLEAPFVPAQRARLEGARLMALQERLDADLGCGAHREVVGELEGLVIDHPDEERFWAQLMLALYRSGSQGAALRACNRLRRHLVDALGVNPSTEVAELEKSILLQDPSLAWPPPSANKAGATGRLSPATVPGPVAGRPGAATAQPPPDHPLPSDQVVADLIRAARRTTPRRRAARSDFLPLVGRDEQLGALVPMLNSAGQRPEPAFAVVVGEPGFGKSRLLEELGARARSQGGLVVVTSAEDDDVLPYRPFADLVREVLGSTMATTFLDGLGPLVADLAWLVPNAPGRPVPPVADVGLARLRLFEAVVELAQAAAQHQDLVFLVDDAHRMSSETAALLGLLLERGLNGRLVIVLAAQTEVAVGSTGFSELMKRHVPLEVRVRPLSVEQVEELLDHAPASGLVAEPLDAHDLYRRTGGVPLLLGAVLAGQPGDRGGAGPVEIARLVAARTRALRPNVREMLQVAALIGPDVDAELVANITRAESRTVRKALDRVVEGGGLLDEAKSEDGYIWRHPLVRQAVIDSLDGPLLRQFREAVGDAWEGQGEALRAARQALEVFDALEVTTRRLLATVVAGVDEAMRTLAFELAEQLCRQGLARCDRRTDVQFAVGLLNRLGSSLAYRARRQEATDAWREAARVARDARDSALLAEVALATEPYARSTVEFPLRWELLNELLPDLPGLSPPAQVRVISAWVNEGSLNHHAQSRPALTDQALSIARQSGDDALLATALTAAHNAQKAVRQVPSHISAELCAVADVMGDPVWQGQAHLAALVDAVTMADEEQARHHLAAYLQAADANPSPRARWEASMVRSTWALLRGDEEASDRHAKTAIETGQRYGIEDSTPAFAIHMFFRSFHEGSLDRLVGPLTQFAQEHPTILAWRAGAGLAMTAGGEPERAREVLDEIVPLVLGSEVDPTWPVAACVTAQLCWDCQGSPAQAQGLLDALGHYPGKVAVLGRFIGECGPVKRYLGLMAARASDDRARSWLESVAASGDGSSGGLWAKRAEQDLKVIS